MGRAIMGQPELRDFLRGEPGGQEDVKKSPVHQRAATERKILAIRGPENKRFFHIFLSPRLTPRSIVHCNPPFSPLTCTLLSEWAPRYLPPRQLITEKCKTKPIPETGHLSPAQPKLNTGCATLRHQAPRRYPGTDETSRALSESWQPYCIKACASGTSGGGISPPP